MHILTNPILLLLILSSCNYTGKADKFDSEEKAGTLSAVQKSRFLNFFTAADTSNTGESVGCAGGVYKLIDNKYVLQIKMEFSVQLDSCYNIKFNEPSSKISANLLIFDDQKASLDNICTDIINVNHRGPSRQLHALNGHLIVAYSDGAVLYGASTYYITAWVKKIVFIDDRYGERIIIENELFWKVLNSGTPG